MLVEGVNPATMVELAREALPVFEERAAPKRLRVDRLAERRRSGKVAVAVVIAFVSDGCYGGNR